MVISGSPALHGEVGRVATAAAVGLVIVQSVEQGSGQWENMAAILVGSDVEVRLPGWRGPVVMVGPAEDLERMWLQASVLGADRVAVLPASAQWLANYLTRLREPTAGAVVVGIVGGCGGAGASTLSILFAAGAAAWGFPVLLVDGDQWGGGLDFAMDAGELPGLRWPDLFNASGPINAEQLASALPKAAGISLLAWAGAPADSPGHLDFRATAAIGEVMQAARSSFGLVVIDVGRSPESLAALGVHCDGFVVVVPSRFQAAAAAARLVRDLPPAPVGLLVRGPFRDGVDSQVVAAAVGIPCIGVMPELRGIADVLDDGHLLGLLKRRKVRHLNAGLLDWLEDRGGSGFAPAQPWRASA